MKDDLYEVKGSYFESTVFGGEEFILRKYGTFVLHLYIQFYLS
jgi:hypothetical protein